MKKQNQFAVFEKTMRDILAVPHSEIKAKLEAEKKEKKQRKANKKVKHDN